MYESFYGFDRRPFLTVPTLDRYFPASSIEAAYQTVTRAIQRCEGPVAIFGGPGLGKTMCCLRIAASIPRNFEVITLASAQLITRRALLQSLLHELHLPYRDETEGDLRLSLLERLKPSDENRSEGLVLIVDEAQSLSIKLLDELRILTNVVHSGVPRLRLVLCGTLRLEETLAHPQMESLNQRLAARCYLTPLNHEESDRYVQYKIELCGRRSEEIIAPDGLEALYRATDGIPRLIDQVADQALLLGAKEKIRPLNAAVIGYAWSLLQQLPNPWSDAIPNLSGSSVQYDAELDEFNEGEESPVEFGSLEEEDFKEDDDVSLASTESLSELSESSVRQPVRHVMDSEPAFTGGVSTKDLFSSFTTIGEDEFRIPVQSLQDYQTLSGVALGDLNHDTIAFEEIQGSLPKESFQEALEFIDFSTSGPTSSVRTNESVRSSSNPFGVSEHDLGAIEQQIEDEMRSLVTNLNSEAIREHFETNTPQLEDVHDDHDIIVEASEPASIGSVWMRTLEPSDTPFAPTEEDLVDGFSDDRDLILIEEEDLETQGTKGRPEASKTKASIHPYARLFSQLRNS